MKMTASTKRYPFSMAKHAHDIELYRNFLFNNDKLDRHQEITSLLLRMMDSSNGQVTFIDGQDLNMAKRIVLWAAEYRDEKNRQHA